MDKKDKRQGSRHRKCAQCGARLARRGERAGLECECAQKAAPAGFKFQVRPWSQFRAFLTQQTEAGNPECRRTLADCLDVKMMVQFLRSFIAERAPAKDRGQQALSFFTRVLMMIVYTFRYYNRVSTIPPLSRGWVTFDPSAEDLQVPWAQIAKELAGHAEAGEKLYKAFARPARLFKRPSSKSEGISASPLADGFMLVSGPAPCLEESQ